MDPMHADRMLLFALGLGVRSLVLLLTAFALALALRNASSAARALLWRWSLLGLVALPALSAVLPPLRFVVPIESGARRDAALQPRVWKSGPEPAAPGQPAAAETTETSAVTPQNGGAVGSANALPASPPASGTPIAALRERLLNRVPAAAFTIWAAGVFLLSIRFAAGLLSLRRTAARCLPAPGLPAEEARAAARELGVRPPVRTIVSSPEMPPLSPMTWGVARPTLLLPAGADTWPMGRLRAVLLHEMAHVSRGDWAARVAADVVCALYWPNPLVWLAARQMRRESEIACDDRVLACGVKASEYASILLEIVRMRKTTDSHHGAAIAMAEPSLLDARVRSALDPGRRRDLLSPPMRRLLAALFLVAILPLGAAQLAGRAKAAAPSAGLPLPLELAQPNAELPESTLSTAIQRSRPLQSIPGATPQAPREAPRQIAWGRRAKGLQIGLERVDGQPVLVGQSVRFRLWVRNTGKKSLSVRYLKENGAPSQRNPFFWNATVMRTLSRPARVDIQIVPQLAETGARPSEGLWLQPAEERLLPMPEMRFAIAEMGNSAVTEPTIFAPPGKARAIAYPFVGLDAEDTWMTTLGTGKLEVEVLKAPAGGDTMAPSHLARPVERAVDLKEASWGAPADGLEAGIHIPGRKRNFAVGERVPMECYLRNITDRDIPLSFAVRLYSNELPIVRDNADPASEQSMKGVRLTGIDPAFLFVLKAHETATFYHPGFVLGDKPLPLPEPNSVPKGLEQYPFLKNPRAGRYTVQQPFAYHIATVDEVDKLAARSRSNDRGVTEPFALTLIRPDGSRYSGEATTIPYYREKSQLTTGRAAFSIGSKQAAAERLSLAAAAARAQEGIAWGTASEGLQAGLRAPKGRTRYPLGSTVAMEYIVRNVSTKQIAFEHDVFPGVAGTIPEVLKTDGKPADSFGFPILHTAEVKRETLKPGEMVVVGRTAMGIAGLGVTWYAEGPGHTTLSQTGEKSYTFLKAAPGSYRMRHLETIVSSESGKLVLYTGYLPLDVFDPTASEKPSVEN